MLALERGNVTVMNILPPGSPGEDLYWQARFSEVLDSDCDPILKALAAVHLRSDLGSYLDSVPVPWRAFLLAWERIKAHRTDDVALLLGEAESSDHPYISCMVPYLYGLLDWRAGIAATDVVSRYGMDLRTDYGVALALEMQAWHDHLREDFPRHLRGLFEATVAYMECKPQALCLGGKCLSLTVNLGAEMCAHGIVSKCIALFNQFQWSEFQEHDRFNTLMGLSLWSLLIGKSDEAAVYARHAKVCRVARCCVAHSLLWTASIATYTDSYVWASDQIQTASEMYDVDVTKGDCPDRRSVLLGLALNYISINAQKAREYLTQYQLEDSGVPHATAYDRRLSSVANITLARISRLNGESDISAEMAQRSYDILMRYGHIYRAGLAAMEVALSSKGGERENWFNQALELLARYSPNSDPHRYVRNAKQQPSIYITEREGEILHAVQECLSNPEIAVRLHISRKTVEGAVSALLRKYGVKNRQELIHKTTLRGNRQI